ncbi:virulence RhuM family protein [Muricauda sp. CAU 1633]|uniref:virulence RhuM family protein n=1 Tax=Allomuricauda sp. CAU 1633 TaxID=2816036 RepID=UPI001A8E0711|nr:virulence RhuM family protein [Muricauda sp. CAU 1633]MBO0324395.1 virulence RhuM family protein [Muricauda sp. CAU 1633]
MDNLPEISSNFLFYNSHEGIIKIHVIIDDDRETIWVTQNSMADIFGTSKQNISYHLKNIFSDGELDENSVVKEILTTASDQKKYSVKFYNLDAIISVGYRVNSYKATQFRIWASTVLKEYMIKGFALDDDRLKQGKQLFGKDYFEELLEKIREIRASERRFYQKITDLYATAIDYDSKAPITQDFYATVQNKLHWAIHQHTAAELIQERANSKKPNMGLTTWKHAKSKGKILKSDTEIAKNYLTEEELSNLNRLVSMYLDFAENMAKRRVEMKMEDWIDRLNAFLQFNEYEILDNMGTISHKMAKKKAHKEYEKFRVRQDKEYESDFDETIAEIKETGKLPEAPHDRFSVKGAMKILEERRKRENLSDFNQKLKKGLSWNPKEHN